VRPHASAPRDEEDNDYVRGQLDTFVCPDCVLYHLPFHCLRFDLSEGRTNLGIVGIFIPLLWLIGAILPAKKGSRYELNQEIAYQRQLEEYTR
jgi:hypothetical protein